MSDVIAKPSNAHPSSLGAKHLFRALIAARGAEATLGAPEDHELQDIGLTRGAVPDAAWSPISAQR
jgi:uncharacterized protein YjiS (DUF1127 family)